MPGASDAPAAEPGPRTTTSQTLSHSAFAGAGPNPERETSPVIPARGKMALQGRIRAQAVSTFAPGKDKSRPTRGRR